MIETDAPAVSRCIFYAVFAMIKEKVSPTGKGVNQWQKVNMSSG